MKKLARARKLIPHVTTQDVVGGISMAFLLIPQALAYARLAGMPAYTGLYAAALPPLAAAFFVSSPYLQTGPTAITSILVAGGLAAVAVPGSGEYVLLAALLALIVGVIRLAIGLLRAGQIVYLMSDPVLRGFMAAAALLIALSQIPDVLGLGTAPTDSAIGRTLWMLWSVVEWNPETVLLAVGTFVLSSLASRLHPLIPGILLATAAGIFYSLATGYAGPVVGDVPVSLPALEVGLPWRQLPLLILPGVVIALMGFSEAASIARTYAARERQRWDPDRDFISQGVGNIVAAVSGGFPVGGSFSRSALAHMLGVRSRWGGAITALALLAFLPFAWMLAPLPEAVLAAIVIAAVVRLARPRPIIELWRLSRPQFFVAAATFLLTIILAPRIDEAVILGILLAIGVHLWREFQVRVTTWAEGGALHVRPEGVLWFGSAQMLEKQVLELLAEHADAHRLVLHMERLGRVDLTASLVLAKLIGDARAAGLETEVIAIHPMTAKALHRVLREGRRKEGDPGARTEAGRSASGTPTPPV
jgi:SulP family sulfate permease